jgi:DUF971 family protein
MTAVPTEIRYDRASRTLGVSFDDGTAFDFPAEFLRVESPSAEVQGHGPSQRVFVGGKRHVGITAIEPVGQYAVRLVFDDGHDSGIFSWEYLHEAGQQQASRWDAYLRGINDRGLSRDP